MLKHLDKKQKKNQTKIYTSVVFGLNIKLKTFFSAQTPLAQWQLHGMQIRRIQIQIYFVFYFFFFISNTKDVGSNPENSKSIQFCLQKLEIFPSLFPIKGLRSCPTMVKRTILRKDDQALWLFNRYNSMPQINNWMYIVQMTKDLSHLLSFPRKLPLPCPACPVQ